MKWCVVIPTYNNDRTLESVIRDVLRVTSDCIVVNDGSTDKTGSILAGLPNISSISYKNNRGKGYALQKGFQLALSKGFDYAITMDSDGQHFASDIPLFINTINDKPGSLIVGTRKLPPEKMRKGSNFANRFSNFWFRFISGVSLPDTQSGFRLYPLKEIKGMKFYTNKYEFELEVLIRSAWRGISLINIPVQVFYPEKNERISHFRPFKDFMRISAINTICVFIALFYIKPLLFFKSLRRDNLKNFLKKNIIHTTDSDKKMTLSVMLGVFMGIVPIWGYQLITAIGLAYLLRLNKFLVIVAANISIFPFTAVILYLSYVTGGIVLSAENPVAFSLDLSLKGFGNNLLQYFVGALVLAVVAALFFGLLTFVLLKMVRRKPLLLD